jgi:uncharacterized membrane protein YkvA (DUF1232 family)
MRKTILFVLAAIAYTLSPYDILPDFIVGWGWLDDAVVLWLLWRYLKREFGGFFQSQKRQAGYNTYKNHEGPGSAEEKAHSKPNGAETYSPKSPYDLLEIDRNASLEEIKQAYRLQASRYHPDKVAHLGKDFQELAETRFKEIQEAYQRILTERTS